MQHCLALFETRVHLSQVINKNVDYINKLFTPVNQVQINYTIKMRCVLKDPFGSQGNNDVLLIRSTASNVYVFGSISPDYRLDPDRCKHSLSGQTSTQILY